MHTKKNVFTIQSSRNGKQPHSKCIYFLKSPKLGIYSREKLSQLPVIVHQRCRALFEGPTAKELIIRLSHRVVWLSYFYLFMVIFSHSDDVSVLYQQPPVDHIMTAVSDSQIFRNIFSTAESAAIWSDSGEKPDELCVLYILTSSEGRTTNYLRFEASLAIAQAKLNIIPQKAADAIVEKCTIDLIDWNELRQQTELIGYAF
jgi:hypothetical protein